MVEKTVLIDVFVGLLSLLQSIKCDVCPDGTPVPDNFEYSSLNYKFYRTNPYRKERGMLKNMPDKKAR